MGNLLETKINDGLIVKDASAVVFIQWVMKKVNAANISPAKASELTSLSAFYPGRLMDDDSKIAIMNKMISAGISL
jgi:hypothetical protein